MAVRVLLVETNRRNRELLQQFLTRHDIDARVADSMETLEGLALENYDCVVIDLLGLDPRIWDTCSRLRDGGIPFAVICPSQAQAISRGSGASGMLAKPIRPQDLLTMIHSLIQK